MIEFSSITTKGGDSGQTSLADGSRRPKDDLLIEVLGDVDELHASLGLLKTALENIMEKDEIHWIEEILIRMGSMIAVPPSHPAWKKMPRIDTSDIEKLETWEKEAMNEVSMPQVFVTYGANNISARADMARAICRRVERHMVTLIRERVMNDLAIAQKFLNRLSDYLFVKARFFESQEY